MPLPESKMREPAKYSTSPARAVCAKLSPSRAVTEWTHNRSQLWNAIEAIAKRKQQFWKREANGQWKIFREESR